MKNLFIAATFLFSVQFASAQSADFKKDVLTYVKMLGTSDQVSLAIEPILSQIPADKQADFKKDFEGTLPSLYDKLAEVYMKQFTHEEIKKILEFYNSPIGKKIQEKTPVLTKEQMNASQSWGMELQGVVMKYMQ